MRYFFNFTDEMSCVPCGMSDLLYLIAYVSVELSYVSMEISGMAYGKSYVLYWMSCLPHEIADVLFVWLVYLNKSGNLFINLCKVRYLIYQVRCLMCQ